MWRERKRTLLEGKGNNMHVDTHTYTLGKENMVSVPSGGADMYCNAYQCQ